MLQFMPLEHYMIENLYLKPRGTDSLKEEPLRVNKTRLCH